MGNCNNLIQAIPVITQTFQEEIIESPQQKKADVNTRNEDGNCHEYFLLILLRMALCACVQVSLVFSLFCYKCVLLQVCLLHVTIHVQLHVLV